jgi:hypothetical protein
MTTTTPQIFGQAKPVANIQTNLLTVANDKQAQISLFVCNQGSVADSFSIELLPSGDSPDPSRYIAYNTPILANGVFAVAGVALNSGDSVLVSTTQGNCSITATGFSVNPG